MNIELREDSVRISGYVNAVERLSKPITEPLKGKIRTFLERIKAGVFRKALKENNDVLVLLNHDKNRVLATTKNNTALLVEDNIGLRAEVTIYDKDVIEKARTNRLVGWSFGFYPNADEINFDGKNEIRTVTDLYLSEVSILDDTKEPAYYGTSIEARAKSNLIYRSFLFNENEEPPRKPSNKDTTSKETDKNSKEEKKLELDDNYLEKLATKIVDKVIEKIEGAGVKKTIPKNPAEEEGKRNIDYSSYEKRIAKIERR